MAQASLPQNLLNKKLSDLKVGESAYVVPWAMEVDQNAKLWLNINSTFSKFITESSTLKVTRTKSGWVCDISECDGYTWDAWGIPGKHPPVVQLITK